MTHRQYLTVSGDAIHGEGLTPDVPAASPVVELGEPPAATDAVLERAIAVARAR